ncbi:putative drug exporter of the RND superfamily [Sanguibacter gelidistatuariae]|uniref:Putative drug exporter of the RND superfamily n=1 Tax=Sanguibacter gelidistatuariae TaxID=1814289 RepID=A0A1G6JW32_9MICO|nr:MMPL family transporter [Sanguibacter gelidistatuariae]SDC22216.1 putative drug exporter of the RND superfamily [Sanguibacter gelidistatuariae]
MLACVFESLGRRIADHPRSAIVTWAVITVLGFALAVFGVHGESLFSRLTSGAPVVPGSQSYEGAAILDRISPTGEYVSLIVDGVTPSATGVADVMAAAHTELLKISGVESVLDPIIVPDGPESDVGKLFTAQDGAGFLVVVGVEPGMSDDAEAAAIADVADVLRTVPESLAATNAGVTGLVGGNALILDAITSQVERDLTTGEAIALPIALIIMVAVFGGFLAAAMPMAGALASIGVGLGLLLGMSYLMKIDASVVNVVTLLGLGLSIDYGLLIVSRFREELQRLTAESATENPGKRRRSRADTQVEQALVTTMGTAGRTVAFSAVTVAISIAGLMVFTPEILRSIGGAGLAVILVAVATALTLVPALLRLAGKRLLRPGILSTIPGIRQVLTRTAAADRDEGVFSRLATRVQRHPAWVMIGCVVVLGVLAIPAAGLQMRNSGIELLPASSPQRQFVTQLAEQFPSTASPEIHVLVRDDEAGAQAFADSIASLDGVDSVTAPALIDDYATVGVYISSGDPGGSQALDVVGAIRDLDPGADYWVLGQAAGQVDFVHALGERVWWAVGIVVLATFVLLFLMTGSVVIPVKALLTNAISLAASLGVLVWVFQDGHLSGLLGFSSTGGIETFVVALVIAFAFGLAMDYEVFLLSRIKELHDEGVDSETAVRLGLQRTGRIITSAAAIIIVVFAGFVFGQLLIIKQVGFALAVAILIDATIVRMLLVPATMTLLGKWNWWAPAPLRRLHERFGITH